MKNSYMIVLSVALSIGGCFLNSLVWGKGIGRFGEEQIVLSDNIQKITENNVFRDPQYFNWCNSVIRGKDGKYHLFYSRWERKITFQGWLTHSKIAHAVSDSPAGPFTYVGTAISFDKDIHPAHSKITAHNPKIKFFNEKYYLYFASTWLDRPITDQKLREVARGGGRHPTWIPLRRNQRTFVATSDSLDGKWKIAEKPLLEPSGPITTLVVNPAITQGNDGKFYLIVKGDKPGSKRFERNQAIAISDFPDRGFELQPKPVIQDWDSEDVSMWYSKKENRFYAIFHAHTYLGLMTSQNGIDWDKAKDFRVMTKRIEWVDGRKPLIPGRLERPFVYVENDIPQVLSAAVLKGNDSFIVFLPLKKK